ncbi:MAG: glutamine--fructose-6-phosphate transaminase (isomerizing) [Balneolaceae bacterium]
MCGIIGVLSLRDATPLVMDGLRRLEYRGYDSAGVATLEEDKIQRYRAQGKLNNLASRLESVTSRGRVGIGHTRWATHGAPTEENAHPHASDRVAVVHNGIIENYSELRSELQAAGYRFETDTDTEVVVHLVTEGLANGLSPKEAAYRSFDRLNGAFALVLMFAGEPDLLVGVRQGTPLTVGLGDGEMYLASDSYALAHLTRKVCFLEDGDRVMLNRESMQVETPDGISVERPVRMTAQSGLTTGKGGYRHYMLKEIHEQPAVIGDTLNSFVNPTTGRVALPEEVLAPLASASRINMVACGTAYYSCMVARYWMEQIAGIPCDVDIASEFRYRGAILPKDGASLFVSQSGETLDTLEALRTCRKAGQPILSIVNTIESTIERESDVVLRTLAGPEIGVASTKAFTTQLTTLACLALAIGERRGVLDAAVGTELSEALRHIPKLAADVIQTSTDSIEQIARELHEYNDILYLGRGSLYPIALEGALKLKEISYIHAEGYAAGELKHGPIALIDEQMPVVVTAPGNDPLFDKVASNLQETVARGARVLLITDAAGAKRMEGIATWMVVLGDCPLYVSPILYALPVQLLAYYVAVAKGTDVDQPRNLAKAVTVE